MIKKIQRNLEAGIKKKCNEALQAAKNRDKSIESGCEFVEACVRYMHYMEGIRTAVVSTESLPSGDTEKAIEHPEQAGHKHWSCQTIE